MQDGDEMTLLFADTLIEDEDTYAFLQAGAAALALPITRIADGRTPLEVFKDERMLGNSRFDPCSKILKRQLLDRWCDDVPSAKCRVVGLDWTEINRFERFAAAMDGNVIAPLIDFKVNKSQVLRMCAEAGLPTQRLYEMGFPHANCGGTCVKAGISQWVLVYRAFPDRFKHWEDGENELREYLGRDVSILRDRTNGESKPLTLTALRERIEQQPELIPFDEWGGCGCAIE